MEKLRADYHIDLRVLGIAGLTGMMLDDESLDLENWQEDYKQRVGGWVLT